MIFWLSSAFAEDPWWVGAPVQSVQIVAPRGGVPDDWLDPLLRVRQGEPLDPANVRLDVATLFRAGEFASVEADVEPWVEETESGEVIEAVLLQYRVIPAPRITKLHVQGNKAMRRAEIFQIGDLELGGPWYEAVDGPAVQRAIVDAYLARGFPDAKIEVDPYPSKNRLGQDAVELWVRVDEGAPRVLSKLTFTGDSPYSERHMRAVARRAGLEEGHAFALASVPKAEEAIRRDLAAPGDRLHPRGGTVFTPLGQWTSARVVPAVTSRAERTIDVTIHVDAGPRLALDVHGLSLYPKTKIREALQIDERLRIGRGWLEDAPDRVAAYLQRRGFFAAKAEVDLDPPKDGVQTLHVRVTTGPRHHLAGGDEVVTFVPPNRRGMQFQGNNAIPDEDLWHVMEQASPEVLRLHRFTRSDFEVGLTAARDLYRSRGFPDASLALSDLQIVPHRGRSSTMRAIVQVEEGPLATLSALEVRGAAFPDDQTDKDVEDLLARPYSPQALDGLALAIVRRHEGRGYLEASSRVLRQKDEQGRISAIILVEPGPLVLLRSQAFRGAPDTNIEFLRRQFDLPLGRPLTQADLERLRRDLYDLGIFRTVSTDVLGDGSARDLLITLEQRPRYGFELGTGVSTDQGVRAFGRATRYNLWGLAHRVELFGLLGLDYRSDSLTDWNLDFLDPEWRAAVTYQAPKFPLPSQQLTVDVLLREQIQERYWRMQRSGLAVSVETGLGPGKQVTLRLRGQLQERRLAEVDPGVILDGEPWAPLLSDGKVSLPSPWREQHSFSLFVLWDRRDDKVMPTRGFLASTVAEVDPDFELGLGDLPPVGFAKSELRLSGYIPVGPLTLHLAGEGGHAEVLSAGGTLAVEDRYRLGGTGSMRGFRRDAVGPRNLVSQPDLDWGEHLQPAIDQTIRENPTRWVSTGGDTMAVATVELLTPLPALGLHDWQGYSATVFADIGDVWLLGGPKTTDQDYRDIYAPILRYAVGVGFRVATPVGPLQLDVASNPESVFATGEKGVLLRDAWDEPALRAHVSLGTLF